MPRLLDLPTIEGEPTNAVTEPTEATAQTVNRDEADSIRVAGNSPTELSVVGYPVHHESEEVALAFLKRLAPLDCDFQLLSTKLLPSQVISQICVSRPDVAVLSVLPPGGLSQLQFMCTEMQAACPSTKIVVAHFGTIRDYDRLLVRMRKKGVTYLTTSVSQTNQLLAVLVEQRREGKRNVQLGRSSIPPSPHLELSANPLTRSIRGDEVTHVG